MSLFVGYERPAMGGQRELRSEDDTMRTMALTAAAERHNGVQGKMTYGVIYPLCVVAHGLSRLLSKMTHEEAETESSRRSLFAEARTDASIATSYALMAWTMLQPSGRHHRPERQS